LPELRGFQIEVQVSAEIWFGRRVSRRERAMTVRILGVLFVDERFMRVEEFFEFVGEEIGELNRWEVEKKR